MFPYTTSQMIITGIIATFGTAMITSKIYTQNITMIIFTLAASISMANQVIVGRYIGLTFKQNAKLYTKKVLYRSLGMGVGYFGHFGDIRLIYYWTVYR